MLAVVDTGLSLPGMGFQLFSIVVPNGTRIPVWGVIFRVQNTLRSAF
jgi:hypothetical protein